MRANPRELQALIPTPWASNRYPGRPRDKVDEEAQYARNKNNQDPDPAIRAPCSCIFGNPTQKQDDNEQVNDDADACCSPDYESKAENIFLFSVEWFVYWERFVYRLRSWSDGFLFDPVSRGALPAGK